MDRVFDGEVRPDDDLFALLDAADPALAAAATSRAAPRGLADAAEHAVRRGGHRGRGLDVTTDFRPGEHEWGLWDAVIQDVIDWLPASAPTTTRV